MHVDQRLCLEARQQPADGFQRVGATDDSEVFRRRDVEVKACLEPRRIEARKHASRIDGLELSSEHALVGTRGILVVGAGNIGYLTSYQLMQAGAQVKAIVEAMDKEGGFPVQANRVRRLGIPVMTSHILVKAIPNIPVLIGAGVKGGQDVEVGLRLGAKGIVLSSAVVLAEDPKKILLELAEGFK